MDHKEKNLKKPKKDGNPRDPTHLGAMVTNTKKIQEWDCKKNYHAIFTKHVNRNPHFLQMQQVALPGVLFPRLRQSCYHKPFSDETLKKNYGEWVKDLKKKFSEIWLEQDMEVDSTNLLTETLHTYPAHAPPQTNQSSYQLACRSRHLTFTSVGTPLPQDPSLHHQ